MGFSTGFTIFFCPGLDLLWTIARTKSPGDIWAYFNHLQSPMIPFGIVKYDRLIMGLQVQEERAAMSCQKIGSSPNSCGIHGLRNLLRPEVQVHEGLPGPGHRICWVQCHKDTKTSRNIYEHHSTSNKSSIFSKDLGAMSFPKHHPGNPSGGTYMCGSFGRIIGGQLLVRCWNWLKPAEQIHRSGVTHGYL